jgi:eukaryotic-like serine/threonine-protein kinase
VPVPQAYTAPHRATLTLPDGIALSTEGPPARRFAISPDGTQLAFVGNTARGPMLCLQSLDDTTPRVIAGSEGAAAPFWSPDSRVVAFHRNDQILKLDVQGTGGVAPLGALEGLGTWAWGPSGENLILMSTRTPSPGIRVFSPQSGTTSDLFVARSSEVYAFPSPLYEGDRGRHFLFTHIGDGEPSSAGVYLGTFGSTSKTRVMALDPNIDHDNVSYASGHLIVAREQMLTARPFDLKTMKPGAEATDVAGPVQALARGGAAYSVSQNGVLVYQPSSRGDLVRLVVHDRKGNVLRTLGDDASYSNVELSPDGSQLAVSIGDATARTRDIWVVDMVRGRRSRFTVDPSDERSAVWSVDGQSLVYTSKGLDLYTKAVGGGEEMPFVKDGLSKDPRGWSHDGEFFVYRQTGTASRNDVWVRPKDPARTPYAFLATAADENYGTFAPDRRWMAYVSDATGRTEVYVTAFPSGQGKWPISTAGGSFPRWRRDGKEIVYLSADNTLVAVPVDGSGSSLTIGRAEALFQIRAAPGPGAVFDMSADGQQFVVNTLLPAPPPPSLVVLFNWPAVVR